MTNDANNHFQFDDNGIQINATNATLSGSNVEILSPSFFLGSATNNISSSNDDLSITTKNLTASGSSVEILTPNFFLGTTTNNISSSNNDLSITTKDLTASGSSVNILTPNFFFGTATNNISSSNDDLTITTKNLTASGSNVSILTDKFFFGSATSNISSSNGNLKIVTDDATLSGSSIGISAPSFILGQNGSQFISGSGGNIQIKGTNFELLGGNITASNVDLSGKISASSGQIGNFNIIANKISGSNITLDADSSRIFKSDENGETDGYYIDFTPGTNFYVRFGTDFAVSSSGQLIASGAKIEGVLTSSAGKIANWTIEPNRLVGGNVRLDSGGQIGVGSIVDASTIATTNAGFLADNNGNVLIKADDNNTNYLKFDVDGGTSALEIKTSAFELVGGNLTISGTVSSSVGNIGGFTINGTQISSSNVSGETGLILKSDGQITASNAKIVGDVTATSGLFSGNVSAASIQATTGSIGGFLITNSEISSSGASGDTGLRLKSSGEITASKAKVTGDIVANTITANTSGQIGGFDIGSNIISASSGNLILKSTGQITASAVSMSGTINASGGIIGGFTIGEDLQNSAGATLQLDGVAGQITASAALINGNSVIGGFNITNDKISSQAGTLVLSSSGQITASAVDLTGKITAQTGTIGGFNIGTDLDASSGTLKLKGATGQITASSAFIGGTSQVAGWNVSNNSLSKGSVVIASSTQRIRLGNLVGFDNTGSNSGIILGLDDGSSYEFFVGTEQSKYIHFDGSELDIKTPSLELVGGNLTISGTLSSSVGNIGGFTIDSSEIKSNNASGDTGLRLKAGGEITASAAKITGDIVANKITANTEGTIGGFTLGANKLSSNNLVLSSSTTETDLIISTSKFQVDGAGGLTASAADINGKITAEDGTIGGFTLGANKLSSTNLVLSSSTTATDEVISASNFIVTAGGQITASNIRADGGTIGGFTLSNQRLTGTSGLIIDSLSGSIFLSSNTSTDGTTIDGAEGIFGHGDDSSKRYTSHAGQFRFTEDSISPPPGSDGIVYAEDQPDSVDSYNGNIKEGQTQGGTT